MDSNHHPVTDVANGLRPASAFAVQRGGGALRRNLLLLYVSVLTSTLAAQEWPIAVVPHASSHIAFERLPPVVSRVGDANQVRGWPSTQWLEEASPPARSQFKWIRSRAADPFAGSHWSNTHGSPVRGEARETQATQPFVFANAWLQPTPAPPSPLPPRSGSASAIATTRNRTRSSRVRLPTPRRPSGYIDSAVIGTRLRMRYDNFQNANAPTRAEYLYPTIGLFGGPGPGPANTSGGITFDRPPFEEAEVDFQELSTYLEIAFNGRLSIFGEFPVRWVTPVDAGLSGGTGGGIRGPNAELQAGAGDFKAGIRFGVVASPDLWLTAQVRVHSPTGEAVRALGVGHSAIDIALLYQRTLSDRLTVFGELQDWQTTSAVHLAQRYLAGGNTTPDAVFEGRALNGNVLRYGVGAGYDCWQSLSPDHEHRLTAVVEIVGWTVLDGLQTDIGGQIRLDDMVFPAQEVSSIRDAAGDTIINGKYGLRYSSERGSIYVGYGHNWTDALWYSDLFRVELTKNF